MFQQYKFNFPVCLSFSFCNTSEEISLFVTKRRNTGRIATSLGARTVLPSGLKLGPFLSQTVYIIQCPVTMIHRCVIIFLTAHSLTCSKQGAAPQAESPSVLSWGAPALPAGQGQGFTPLLCAGAASP